MKNYCRLLGLIAVLVFQFGCTSVIVRGDGPSPECDANVSSVIYQGTLADISGVFLYGTLEEDAYNLKTTFGQRLGIAVLAFPFALIDLPFSFVAESTVFMRGSIKEHKAKSEQCEKT